MKTRGKKRERPTDDVPPTSKEFRGLKELNEFTKTEKKPKFINFVNKNKEELSTWSFNLAHMSPSTLQDVWKQRFALSFKASNSILLSDTLSTGPDSTWVDIIAKSKAKINLINRYQESGIKALTEVAPLVEKTVAQLVEGALSSLSTSAPTIPNSGTDSPTTPVPTTSTSASSTSASSTSTPASSTSLSTSAPTSTASTSAPTSTTSTTMPLFLEKFDDISFRLAYKKLRGDTVTEEEMAMLKEAEIQGGPSIYHSLLKIGNDNVHQQNGQASYFDKAFTELSLSGIINLLDSEMEALYRKHLSQQQWHLITEANDGMSLDNFPGMSEASCEHFSNITAYKDNTDRMLSYIAKEKTRLLDSGKRGSDEYVMLRIMELVTENFSLWSSDGDESELTFYRRIASIFDILFHGTEVIMADGEQTCKATKLSINFNKAAYLPFESPAVYGRKIDLMLKLGRSSKEKVEISSNEWKKLIVRDETKMNQQAKNIRSNVAILKHLMTNHNCLIDSLLAMDFVGNFGYMYMLKYDEKVGCFLTKVVSTIMIPTSVDNIKLMENSLNYFFKLKFFIKDMGVQINQAIFDKQLEESLPNLNHFSRKRKDHASTPTIFWSSKCFFDKK